MGGEYSTVSVPSSDVHFKINLDASTDSKETLIEAANSFKADVYPNDLEAFQISNLNSAAAKLPRHQSLDGYLLIRVYVRAPTIPRFQDYYLIKTLKELKKIIKPVKTEVVKLTNETVIVANRKFVNNSNVSAKYNVGITHEEQHSVTTSWSNKIDLNVDLNIEYKVLATSMADFSFQTSWGKDFNESKTVTIGSQTGVEVELEPGQEVVARLRVTRYVMDVKVTFEISLEGEINCKYESFWKLFTPLQVTADINDVLKAGNLPTVVTTSEVLRLSFCTDGEILLSNS